MALPLAFPLAFSLAPLATAITGWFSGSKNSKTNKEIAEQQQANQLKLAYLNIQAQKNLEENRQGFQGDLEMSRQQFQERMTYLGFKQQRDLKELDQQFQLRLRGLDHQHQQEVEEFRAKVNVAINQKNLDFQAWKFDQEIALQKEMALFNRETQFAIVASQRETAQQQPEINKIFENWPLKNPPIQILNSHPNHLRIFISPPELDYDRFINLTDPKNHNFPRVESFLGSRLLKLLNQYYPRNSALRPTQLLDESWDSKRFAGGSSIIALADRLESEPLVVLETKVTLNKYLSLRVAYKDMGQKSYFYDEIIPRFEYGDILLAAYKARTGEIDPTDKQKIQITSDDWEALYEVLEVAHCIVAAWIADIHHLIHYNAQPLLPKLLPDITRELPSFLLADEKSVLNTLMQSVINGYKDVFQQLEKTEFRYQIPELFLDLAQGVINFGDQSTTKLLTKDSITTFLRIRNCTNLAIAEHHNKQTKGLLNFSDKMYIEKLEAIDSQKTIPEVECLLQIWHQINLNAEQVQLPRSLATDRNPNIPIGGIEMSTHNTLSEIFNNKYLQLQNYYNDWTSLQQQIKQCRPNAEETTSISNKDLALQKSIKQFKQEIDHPLITLATTGTTSGGKSSLVNLLCGAEIMPVAVQEMSAGTVIINHHPSNRTLKIPSVKGLESHGGEWNNLSDEEIRQRLTNLMNAYLQLRAEKREPPAPRMELQYPTRLGMNPEAAGLPPSFRLRIIDLPGLKYVSDEHNGAVIRNEIKPALCLVTYNSEATDPKLQEQLLEQVVEQVRELRGSPVRMLFVLNRIDAFRRDAKNDEWKEQTEKFIDKTLRNIRSKIAEALPEYKEQAAKLNAQPLSTNPALYAYQALTSNSENAVQPLEKIEDLFKTLIPKELIKKYPRDIREWEESQRKQVAEVVWNASYGCEFDKTLQEHIRNNIPQLLLPHLIQSVVEAGQDALNLTHQIAYAHLNATKDRYQKECDRLASTRSNLHKLREEFGKELVDVLTPRETVPFVEWLADTASDLERNYKLPQDSLIPLYDWRSELGKAIESFSLSVYESIMQGSELQGTLVDSLAPVQRQELSNALILLKNSGYLQKYAEKGGIFKEKKSSSSENEKLKSMRDVLSGLAKVVSINLEQILKRVTERETERIQNAFRILAEQYTHLLAQNAKSLAPDLLALSTAPLKFSQVKRQENLPFKIVLTADFYVCTVEDPNIERVPFTKRVGMFFKGTPWKDTKIKKLPPTISDTATIPRLSDIFSGFAEQVRCAAPEQPFLEWLHKKIDEFLRDIEDYQENLLKQYQNRLDQVMQQVTEEKDTNIGKWQPITDKVAILQDQLSKLRKVD
jgi:predicted GTPase